MLGYSGFMQSDYTSPKLGAEVLDIPRPPFIVETNPRPRVVNTPRRLGVVLLAVGLYPAATMAADAPGEHDGMSGRPTDTATTPPR